MPLLGTCLLMVLASVTGWLAISQTPTSAQPSTVKIGLESSPQRTSTVPFQVRPPKAETYYAVIAERPIFAPSRHPANVEEEIVEVAPTPEESVLPPDPVQLPLVVLLGVIGVGDRASALVSVGDGVPSWVEEGAQLGGWHLTEIGPNWIEIEGAGQVLHMDMYPK